MALRESLAFAACSVLSTRFVGTELGMLLAVKAHGSWRLLAANLLINACEMWGVTTHMVSDNFADWAPATPGPPAGRHPAGVGGGVPTERIPRDKPPNLARRGEIATKTQKTTQTSTFLWTLAEPCAPAGPLRSYLRRV
jgi:hypothetical protein